MESAQSTTSKSSNVAFSNLQVMWSVRVAGGEAYPSDGLLGDDDGECVMVTCAWPLMAEREPPGRNSDMIAVSACVADTAVAWASSARSVALMVASCALTVASCALAVASCALADASCAVAASSVAFAAS